MKHAHQPAALRAVIDFFEGITPGHAARIDEIYAADAWFKDPFNEVTGTQAIGRIFSHMFYFESTHFSCWDMIAPAQLFVVTQAVSRGGSPSFDRCTTAWVMHARPF